MMGLANQDGSMTMTLYLPDKGEISVEALSESRSKVRDYFETFYPDVIPMMPNYLDEYQSNPDGFLKQWHQTFTYQSFCHGKIRIFSTFDSRRKLV